MPKGNPEVTREMVYVAGPLFNDAERAFNRRVKEVLSARFDVYLPQEDGRLLVDMIARGQSAEVAGRLIFGEDVAALNRCEAVVVILDGRSIDEGAAFELGLAYGLGRPCYGLQTDARRLLPCGNNPMIQHSLTRIFTSVSELDQWVRERPGVGHSTRAGQRTAE